MASGSYWVTWKDESDSKAARNSAAIWGPQATAPAKLSGFFQAGPFPTKAAAQAYEKAIGTGSIIPTMGTPIVGDIQPPANPLGGLAAIGDFFSRLTQAATWERIGEVVLGLLLIAVGVAHITHAVPIATKIAGAAALA